MSWHVGDLAKLCDTEGRPVAIVVIEPRVGALMTVQAFTAVGRYNQRGRLVIAAPPFTHFECCEEHLRPLYESPTKEEASL